MRRKRSSALTLTSMLAGAASMSLAACSDTAGSSATGDWNEVVENSDPVPVEGYRSLAECQQSGAVPPEVCQEAYDAALADNEAHAPRYDRQSTCEAVHGVGACTQQATGAGTVFAPLFAGFVIGRMMDHRGQTYYRGTALYREREEQTSGGGGGGGGYITGWGGRARRDYATGGIVMPQAGIAPPAALREAPARVQTRAMVRSRGGFGARNSGRGFGG